MENVIKADVLTSIDATGLLWTFQRLNPLGFKGPAVLVRIINDSFEPTVISFDDGVTVHDYIGKHSTLEIYPQKNSALDHKMGGSNVLKFSKGTIVSIASAGSRKGSGYIFMAVYYQ